MLKHSLCRDALVKIYISFIRPILEYGDIVWDHCNERESILLEDIQITAARIITGLRINSSRSNLYQELGWDMLCVRRKVHKGTWCANPGSAFDTGTKTLKKRQINSVEKGGGHFFFYISSTLHTPVQKRLQCNQN